MQHLLNGWLHKHVSTLSDGLAVVASIFIVAAVMAYWFMPTGSSCATTLPDRTVCQTVSLASSAGWESMAITPLAMIFGLSLGWLFFHFRHVRILLIAFGLVTIVFFILSFGLDGPLMPAAIVSLIAGGVSRTPIGPSKGVGQ